MKNWKGKSKKIQKQPCKIFDKFLHNISLYMIAILGPQVLIIYIFVFVYWIGYANLFLHGGYVSLKQTIM